ncbi:cytosolic endo-beta-N-acetylglucosaminidase 1-like isoform X2 [Wolffia australiana]
MLNVFCICLCSFLRWVLINSLGSCFFKWVFVFLCINRPVEINSSSKASSFAFVCALFCDGFSSIFLRAAVSGGYMFIGGTSHIDLKNRVRMDPSKPSLPVAFAIEDLDLLAARSFMESFHYPYIKASVPLSADVVLPQRRRLLVCHDMAGGYGDDKWVQGGSNSNAYTLWQWHHMDVFVYFSHKLVTIPPPCWINAAHTHGVKVLGTFILEWDEGRDICQSLLQSTISAQMYAERLVEIAASLGFEGWLINMEVKLDLAQIPILVEFLGHLTKTMHEANTGSLIIWYDSVTECGKLQWQNQLNANNKIFFDLCDGIFVNYTWKISAIFAGDRRFDVYMGIDVFGRNTYGGGQWSTNIALDLLKKVNVSAAIFAPGWVYETNQGPDFQTAANCWWGLVEESWGTLLRYPKLLPFFSNFDQGRGHHFSMDGIIVAEKPWNNISCQTVQPALIPSVEPVGRPINVQLNLKNESYSGGSSLTFTGKLGCNFIFSTRIFLVDLPIGDVPLLVSYSVRRCNQSSIIGLSLSLSTQDGKEENSSVLIIEGGSSSIPVDFHCQFSQILNPTCVPKSSEWDVLEAIVTRPGDAITEICAVCCTKAQPMPGAVTATFPSFYAALGHVGIVDFDSPRSGPSLSVTCQHVFWANSIEGTRMVALEVCWERKDHDGVDIPALWYNIFASIMNKGGEDKGDGSGVRFLGVTRLNRFFVDNLMVSAGASGVRFIVQACGLDGACQKLDHCPTLDLPVKEP